MLAGERRARTQATKSGPVWQRHVCQMTKEELQLLAGQHGAPPHGFHNPFKSAAPGLRELHATVHAVRPETQALDDPRSGPYIVKREVMPRKGRKVASRARRSDSGSATTKTSLSMRTRSVGIPGRNTGAGRLSTSSC